MTARKTTQTSAILSYLLAGNTLTGIEALQRFGTMKLASRVSELKQAGHAIESRPVELPSGKRVSLYWMLPGQMERAAA